MARSIRKKSARKALPGRSRRVALTTLGASLAITANGCANIPSSSIGDTQALPPSEGDYVVTRRFSPLDEYLSLVLGLGLTRDEQYSHFQTLNVRREELVAQCMNNQGFDYALFIDRTPIRLSADMERPFLDESDWVSQWGYGITTSSHDSGAMNVFTTNWGEFSENDPNLLIYETLSQTERAQWRVALWGEWDQIDNEGFTINETIGCLDNAWQQGSEELPQSIFQSDEFAPLFNAWMQMLFTLHNDVSDADRDWSTCMADNGFPGLNRQFSAEQSIDEAFGEIYATQRHIEWHRQSWTQANLDEVDWTAEDLAHGLAFLDMREQEEIENLAALREREINTAIVDLNCRVEVDFQNRRDGFEIEVETQFVNDHRAALAALRDAAEQRGVTWRD